MWPWEHAAVGYLLLSAWRRTGAGTPPTALEALAVLVGTQLPDLIDKPLAWGLHLVPSGYAIGHSALVALPVGALLLWSTRRWPRWPVVGAVVMGYWSHLVADVLDPLRYGRLPAPRRVLWPVVAHEPYSTELGLRRGWIYLTGYLDRLVSGALSGLDLVYLLLPVLTIFVWLLDGAPGWTRFRECLGGG